MTAELVRYGPLQTKAPAGIDLGGGRTVIFPQDIFSPMGDIIQTIVPSTASGIELQAPFAPIPDGQGHRVAGLHDGEWEFIEEIEFIGDLQLSWQRIEYDSNGVAKRCLAEVRAYYTRIIDSQDVWENLPYKVIIAWQHRIGEDDDKLDVSRYVQWESNGITTNSNTIGRWETDRKYIKMLQIKDEHNPETGLVRHIDIDFPHEKASSETSIPLSTGETHPGVYLPQIPVDWSLVPQEARRG